MCVFIEIVNVNNKNIKKPYEKWIARWQVCKSVEGKGVRQVKWRN